MIDLASTILGIVLWAALAILALVFGVRALNAWAKRTVERHVTAALGPKDPAAHQPAEPHGLTRCDACGQPWPCDVVALRAHVIDHELLRVARAAGVEQTGGAA